MKKLNFKIVIILSLIVILLIIPSFKVEKVDEYDYKIINTYPHDKNAFTQGFLYKDGYLYEGTGRYGKSSIRKVDIKTGKIIKIHKLAGNYFGEGISILNNKIYQLTWKSKVGFIYDMDFKLIDKFNYDHEGWGLTNNGKQLIMSDGSDKLYFLNPDTLKKEREIEVKDEDKAVKKINELEYINGEIYANVWQDDYIIKINPDNGKVTGIINLSNIIEPTDYNYELNVLNGIAYDNKNDRLFVTGKLWPKIFEIKLHSKN